MADEDRAQAVPAPQPAEAESHGPANATVARLRGLLRVEGIVLAVIFVGALKISAPVVVPLVFALFLVALFFPLQRRLQQYMRAGLSTLLTLIVLLAAVASFGTILWFSLRSVVARLPSYQEELHHYVRVLEGYGFTIPGFGSDRPQTGEDGAIPLVPDLLLEIVPPILGAGGLITLTFSYLILALLGFDDYARRVRSILPANKRGQWLEIAQQVSQDFQGYMVIRTVTGLISGIAVGVATWLLGVEFAFIWGLLTYLFSYIPIFGTIASSLLLLLFALGQFDRWQEVLFVALAIGAIHGVQGNFISPVLYGKYLKPTPLAVLLSVTFWGWLWNLPGAFIGVPLTILFVLICSQFRQTRWIAKLLADID